MAKLSFDLSAKSVNAVIKKLKKDIELLQGSVNQEFIRLSLLWIRTKAIENLTASEIDNIIVDKILQGFEIEVHANYGKLINSESKAVYIEFGVGIEGAGSHPAANTAGYEYNVPSNKKHADGSWTFKRRIASGIDIKPENFEEAERAYGNTVLIITTYGQKGELYLYNAVMDYANNPVIPQMLYKQAFNKYIK